MRKHFVFHVKSTSSHCRKLSNSLQFLQATAHRKSSPLLLPLLILSPSLKNRPYQVWPCSRRYPVSVSEQRDRCAVIQDCSWYLYLPTQSRQDLQDSSLSFIETTSEHQSIACIIEPGPGSKRRRCACLTHVSHTFSAGFKFKLWTPPCVDILAAKGETFKRH